MTDALDFSQKYEYKVDVLLRDGDPLSGAKLTFGAGSLVQLTFNGRYRERFTAAEMSRLLVRTDDGAFFTLCNCSVRTNSVFANFIVAGDLAGGFNQIAIRYTEISEWFFVDDCIEADSGDSPPLSDLTPLLHATVRTDAEEFQVTGERAWSFERDSEDRGVMREHVVIRLGLMEMVTEFQTVRDKVTDLACLFGILFSRPVNVVGVWVTKDGGPAMGLYFPFYKATDREGSHGVREQCLMPCSALDGLWQEVLQRFFVSSLRGLIWRRLAGMQRYSDFWEYRVLGYVSLLDQLTTQLSGGKNETVRAAKPERVDAFKRGLAALSTPLTDDQHRQVMDVAEKAFAVKRERTFQERFTLALDSTAPDLVRILNFSADDFREIRKLRDAVAHADEILPPRGDLTPILIIINKIQLLLTWWFCDEMGVDLEKFARGIDRTFSELRSFSGIDRSHLARVAKTAEFIRVSEPCMQAVDQSRIGGTFSCFVRLPSGEVNFSERYSRLYEDWRTGSHPRAHHGQARWSEIFGVTEDRVKHVSRAYLETANIQREVHAICIICQVDGVDDED